MTGKSIATTSSRQPVRHWNSYYCMRTFSFWLEPDGGRPALQIVSCEATPAYHWRMGTTYPKGVSVDWKSRPRVRVLGVWVWAEPRFTDMTAE